MNPAHRAYLKALAAALASVAAADAAGLIHLLPQEVAKWLAIGLSGCAFGAHVLEGFLRSIEPKP